MKTLKDVSLHDLLPENLDADSSVSNSATAIDPQLRFIAENTDLALVYARLDDLTSEQLDHLAVQFYVQPWDSSWTKERKLLVFKAMIETKRKRGTRKAVEDAVAAIMDGYSWTITEWWEEDPPGEPYTFDVGISLKDGQELSAEDQIYLEQAIYESKSIRSHNTLTIGRSYSEDLRIGAICSACSYSRVVGERAPLTTELLVGSSSRPAAYAHLVA